jgi:membrane-associated phospholipid phosphatase
MKNLLSAQRSSAPTVGRRFRMHAGVLAVVLAAGCAVPAASADVITDWNQQLLDSIRASNVAPPAASRMMAMMHTAQHDAVNAVSNRYATYQQGFSAPSNTSKEAAAAKAARDVLATFFPSRVSQFDSQLNTHLSTLAPGASRDQGVALGSAVASGIFNTRSTDGSANALPPETGGNIPGQWRPTGPAFAPALLPQWGRVTPFAVNSSQQFMPGPPPAIDSAEYAAAYSEVRNLGGLASSIRTQYQTDTAFLWRAGPNTVTPPGQWNQIAQQVVMSKNLSIEDSARTFALLGMAVADAGITAWETKNTYDFWRPESAIQLAGANGLDPSDADPTWRPLLTTPNHQSYTSGHSTFSAAAATVLALLFGDDQTFTVAGDGRVREYSSLWAAAQDAGMSRIYGGIHWQFDNQAGLSSGSAIGAWVVNTALIPSPSAAGIMALGGMMVMRRRRK